jgi:hypothetical protein
MGCSKLQRYLSVEDRSGAAFVFAATHVAVREEELGSASRVLREAVFCVRGERRPR